MSVNLSKEQKNIVEAPDGPILVLAGPGSGKTRVVIERIKHLLLTKEDERILAITFSNMAADEMRDRLNEDDSLTTDKIDLVSVNTIHSFCLDLFCSYSYLINLPDNISVIEKDEDRIRIIKNIIVNHNFIDLDVDSENLNKKASFILNSISSLKRELKDERAIEDATLKEIYSLYNAELINQNYIDFDDILLLSYRILVENPSVCNIFSNVYNYVFVDEAQDLNLAQYAIINTIFSKKNTNICFVGDPNQSIYGFNGSSSKYMLNDFVSYYNPTQYKLEKNYRSAKRIVEFADTFKKTKSTIDCFYDGMLSTFSFVNEQSEANFIRRCINRLIENGYKDIDHKLSFSDFAVIGRNRYSLDTIIKTLQEHGLPIYIKKSKSGIELDSTVMRIFDLSIRLLINEKDYIHRTDLFSLLRIKNSNSDWKQAMIQSGYDYILDLSEKMLTDPINIDYYFQLISETIESHMPNGQEKEFALCDIQEYKNHWNKYCLITSENKRSLLAFRNAISLGKTADNSASDGVNILSAHMSKGLQFDVVFIVGLTEGSFPDYRSVINGGSELEQEKNNMYVAVTRAKRICILTYPRTRTNKYGNFAQKKSRFLADVKVEEKN